MGPALGRSSNPFARIDKARVIGMLQATGSRDPDVLYAQRAVMFTPVRLAKLAGAGLMLVGALLCLSVVKTSVLGPAAGVTLIAFGWWVRRRSARNTAAIEAGFAEYAKAPAA